MTNQLYRNLGNGRFEDCQRRAGAVFTALEVGRGAAFGDIDNDGDIDVVVGNAAGPLRLLVNNVGNRQHWLGLRLRRRAAGRATCSARASPSARRPAAAVAPGARRRQLRVGQRSARARRPRRIAGPGDRARAVAGRQDEERGRVVPIDRWTTLKQGTGK